MVVRYEKVIALVGEAVNLASVDINLNNLIEEVTNETLVRFTELFEGQPPGHPSGDMLL